MSSGDGDGNMDWVCVTGDSMGIGMCLGGHGWDDSKHVGMDGDGVKSYPRATL